MPGTTQQAGPPETPKRSLYEQHAQSVLLTVITAAVLYSATFVVSAREDAARIAIQVTTLTNEVAALRSQFSSMQGAYVMRDDFRDHETRLRLLESRALHPPGRP